MDLRKKYMRKAIALSVDNIKNGGGPFGAVIVKDGKIISTGVNRVTSNNDPTAHAEVNAIRKAAKKLGTWRLDGCDMYVTLEPCPMCASAIIQSRIKTLYIGAMDNRAGAAGSVVDLFRVQQFNHRVDVAIGLLHEPCAEILKKFFQDLRTK